MRKKLALLLVLALVISLVPMSAFAASDNGVTKVVKIKDGEQLNDASNVPYLRIKNDSGDFTDKETFRLELENATWLGKDDTVRNSVYAGENIKLDSNAQFEALMAEEIEGANNVEVKRRSSSVLEVTINQADSVDTIRIPMLVEMDGKGEAAVKIDPWGSNVSSGKYVFANIAGGDTITTIDGVEKFADTVTLKTIEISETAIGAMGEGGDNEAYEIELRLPSKFEWVDNSATADDIEFAGGLANGSIKGEITYNDNILKFEVQLPESRSAEGSIFISGLKIKATKNAKAGDVVMTIKGDNVTTEKIVVAEYTDYGVTVEAAGDPAELFSGRYDADYNNTTDDFTAGEDHELVELVIEEEIANSWLTNRKTTIEFPSWVKIIDVAVTDSDNLTDADSITTQLDAGDNYIEFTVDKADDDDTAMVELQFYVSIEAGRSGDIEAVVGGRALPEEQTVVLGTAIAPVDVEVSPADVRTGVKKQALNKIVITENKEGAIMEDNDLVLTLEDGEWTEVPDIEVTEGDLELDIEGAEVDHKKLTIPVKSDSTEASTIEITNAAIDLHRSVPEGEIELYVGGDAVVANDETDNNDDENVIKFKEDSAATVVVAKVVTPADPNVGVKEVVFTIGESTFTVDGVEQTMDTAPYIKDGRTMLPVRYVAQALGVAEDNVVWNPVTRTVTIFKGDRVVLIEIGSAELKVNGTPIYMDTVAEIKDGRTMLPISFIGKALGAQVTWDAEARTVTIK